MSSLVHRAFDATLTSRMSKQDWTVVAGHTDPTTCAKFMQIEKLFYGPVDTARLQCNQKFNVLKNLALRILIEGTKIEGEKLGELNVQLDELLQALPVIKERLENVYVDVPAPFQNESPAVIKHNLINSLQGVELGFELDLCACSGEELDMVLTYVRTRARAKSPTDVPACTSKQDIILWFNNRKTTSAKRKTPEEYIAAYRGDALKFGFEATAFDAMTVPAQHAILIAVRWAMKPSTILSLDNEGKKAVPTNVVALYKEYRASNASKAGVGVKVVKRKTPEEKTTHFWNQAANKRDGLIARYAGDVGAINLIPDLSGNERFYLLHKNTFEATKNALIHDSHYHQNKAGRAKALKLKDELVRLQGLVNEAVKKAEEDRGNADKSVTPTEAEVVKQLGAQHMRELIDYLRERLGFKVANTAAPAPAASAAGQQADGEGAASGAPIAEHDASMAEEDDDVEAGDQQPIDKGLHDDEQQGGNDDGVQSDGDQDMTAIWGRILESPDRHESRRKRHRTGSLSPPCNTPIERSRASSPSPRFTRSSARRV